ncbi:MAG: homoserine dehydrogenase [Oscillospiraceae bacterium]|nr:homoserine dehydrogenase [Oscillospiraceae bacterium]
MIKAAILGFGTVGSGVAEVLSLNEDKITRTTGGISLKYIVDIRDFPGNRFESLLTKDFAVVENDPEVKIVVETIGGARIAYDFTKRCLLQGKTVVTSNKELVATHGIELMEIAKEHGCTYYFEASVGGGIPIIRPIAQCLASNNISEIYGILNGTTNYILTEMKKNGLSFDTALRQAQEMGYAEADPAADIEGHDVCRKICILAAMCFGHHVYPEDVPTEGIQNITAVDVDYAEANGYKIKLLGRALEHDGKAYAYVAPHLVPVDNLIADVEGVMNGIVVKGNAIGTAMFYGPGAGKMPTASAVVADVMDAAKHLKNPKKPNWADSDPEHTGNADDLEYVWYVRSDAKEGIGLEIAENEDEYVRITPAMTKQAVLHAYEGSKVFALIRVLQ